MEMQKAKLPPLPKPTYPIYDGVLPFTKRPVKYRPFNVREQRSILTAAEASNSSKDPFILSDAIVQAVEACTGIKVSEIPVVDFEYLCLKIKGASVDNDLFFSITDPETEETIKIKTKIHDFEVVIPEGYNENLKISENELLQMRPPSVGDTNAALRKVFKVEREKLDEHQEVKLDASTPDHIGAIAASCLSKYYQGDTVYDFTDYSLDDRFNFLDDLTDEALVLIKEFFENVPYIKREIKYKRADGSERTLVIEGIQHFFK